MIRFILALAILIVMLSLPHGDAPKQKRYTRVNADFFFANYTDQFDIMEGVKAYATTLCLIDKTADDTPQAWLAAGRLCYDTYASDTDDSSSNDGGWKDYQRAAYLEIKALCSGIYAAEELCKLVR